MRGKWLLLTAAAAILAVTAAGVLIWRARRSPVTTAAPILPAAAGYTGATVALPGVIEAAEVVAVPVPVDGTVERFLVDIGQSVSEGQLLAQIRNSGLESERETASTELSRMRARLSTAESRLIAMHLEASRAREQAIQARTEVDAAEKALQRQRLLFSKGAAGKLALDKAEKDYEAAQSAYQGLDQVADMSEKRAAELNKEVDALRQTLDERTEAYEGASAQIASGEVTSPVDGFVLARRGQPGDEVTIEMEDLFRIAVNLSSLMLMVQPEPPVLARIRLGQEAIIQIAEAPEGIQGKVSEVTGNQVWIEFTSPNSLVKPGMTAQVVIKLT